MVDAANGISALDLRQDFFSLFELPAQFRIDADRLDQNYRALQSRVHPDKFTHLPESERHLSVQWATRVNEAYQTLRHPLPRAKYLLSLRGTDIQEEKNTVMPFEFLSQQMEWHEALAAAKHAGKFDELLNIEQQVKSSKRNLELALAQELDDAHNDAAASGIVRKLKFIEKLLEEIASATDELDN